MQEQQGFRVEQEHFRGSLGELAHALRSHDLPPERIDLYALVRDYLAYFEAVAASDLELATEALPAVAQVIELKVRLLLPRPPRDEDAEDEGDAALDDALDAVALLEELEDAILFLRRRRDERRLVLPARLPRPDYPRPERPVRAGAHDLARLAGRYRLGSYFELAIERLTLAGAMKRVMSALRRLGRGWLFDLAEADAWAERTVSFAALLELVKQGRVHAQQDAPFAPIRVERGARAEQADAWEGDASEGDDEAQGAAAGSTLAVPADRA